MPSACDSCPLLDLVADLETRIRKVEESVEERKGVIGFQPEAKGSCPPQHGEDEEECTVILI